MNITLDDASPQIEWISASQTWSLEDSLDPLTDQYFKKTFHATTVDGDAMRVRCRDCSALAVYGALRANHGIYTVQLDNEAVKTMSGMSQDPIIQGVLYSQGGLAPDVDHTLTITNRPSLTKPAGAEYWLDVDYVVITAVEPGQRIFTTTVDDSSPQVRYSGQGWFPGPPLQPEDYLNTTAHITQDRGDSLALSWSGHSCALYGGLFFDHGNYTVSLDGAVMGNFNGSSPHLAPGTALYAVTGLTDGPHEIVVTNVGQGVNGSFFDFDYAQYNSSIDPSASVSSGVSTAIATPSIAANSTNVVGTHSDSENGVQGGAAKDSTGSSGTGRNAGAVAGGVVGGLVALAILGALIWIFCFRHKKGDNYDGYDDRPRINLSEGKEIKPYFTSPDTSEGAYAAAAGYATYSDYSSAKPYSSQAGLQSTDIPSGIGYQDSGAQQHQTVLPYLTGLPPPPASSATSYPHLINPPSSVGHPGTIHEGIPASSHSTSSSDWRLPSAAFARAVTGVSSVGSGASEADSTDSRSIRSPITPNQTAGSKSIALQLPFTAQLQGTSSIDLAERHAVEGRPLDIGPAAWEDKAQQEMIADAMPPPDYRQATQPLPGQRPPGAATP